jgi:hypothetical protein
MTLRRKLSIAALALLIMGAVCFTIGDFRAWVYFALRGTHFALHPAPPLCKQRAAEFSAKVELMQREANDSLKVGTRKADVVRFFASENVPLSFDQIGQDRQARGTLFFKGLAECENIACGDDSTLIGVRVGVDADGAVASDPVVAGMYTDCL